MIERSAHQLGARRPRTGRSGPSAKTTTASPILTLPDSAPLNPVEAMSARSTTCSSVTPSGNGLRLAWAGGHEEVFGLGAVDRVAEAPATDGLEAVAMAALAEVAGQAGAALAAGGDRADEDALADLVAGDAGAELVDHADRLVADDQAGPDRVLALEDVDVGSADGRRRDADRRPRPGPRVAVGPPRRGCRSGRGTPLRAWYRPFGPSSDWSRQSSSWLASKACLIGANSAAPWLLSGPANDRRLRPTGPVPLVIWSADRRPRAGLEAGDVPPAGGDERLPPVRPSALAPRYGQVEARWTRLAPCTRGQIKSRPSPIETR